MISCWCNSTHRGRRKTEILHPGRRLVTMALPSLIDRIALLPRVGELDHCPMIYRLQLGIVQVFPRSLRTRKEEEVCR